MMDFTAEELKKHAAAWAAANEHNKNFHRARYWAIVEKIARHMENMQARDTKRRPGAPRGSYPPGYSISTNAYWWGVATQRLDRALRLCGGGIQR